MSKQNENMVGGCVCVCVYEREIVTFALLLITTEYCHWCL